MGPVSHYIFQNVAASHTISASFASGTTASVVSWVDTRGGIPLVYVQRFDESGIPQWATNGVPVFLNSFGQSEPFTLSDGRTALVARNEYRGGSNKISFSESARMGVPLDPGVPKS